MKKLLLLPLFILASTLFIPQYCGAQNTTLYGMTQGGGANSDGVLYDYNLTANSPGTLVNFAGTSNGSAPYGGLTPDYTTGYLYGMTYSGGTYNLGELFSYNSCKGETTVVNFQSNNAQAHPYGNLVYDTANGLFYGMTSQGGVYNDGVLFSFDPTNNAETLLVTFNGTNGANPHGSLALNPLNGLFYGMTYGGGTSNWGVIFTFNPATNALSVVYNLATSGYAGYGYGNLTWDPADSIFGVMTSGVGGGGGNLFYFNPKLNTFVEYTSFRGIWGDYPYGSLTYDPVNKRLYGMTEEQPFGGFGNILWYTPTPANAQSIFSFNGGTEGKYPFGCLTWNPNNGLFYGTAQMGGTNDSGVMYSFNPTTNAQTVLINFTKSIGALPYNDLMYDPATQMLYGMTYAGGTNNDGVIYKYDVSTNTETVLVNFNGTNGANPWGDLAYDPVNGKLYGLTLNGGTNGNGSIIMLDTTTNTESAVYSFPAYSTKESLPFGKLALDPVDGNLYGMSSGGGSYNHGTIFRLNPATGKDTSLLSFNNTAYPLGANPQSSLTYDTVNGLFYGMTNEGGSANEGVLFSFNPVTGKDSTLVNFTGANGESPLYTNLTYDPANQLFYGMTQYGGANNWGVLFSFNPATDIETVLYNFDYTTSAPAEPEGSLLFDPVDGLLYGTSVLGGTSYPGTLFSFNTSSNTLTIRYNFSGTNGTYPRSTPFFNPADSNLYGVTWEGGTSIYGAIYKFNPTTNTETVLDNFSGTNGEYPTGDITIITSPKPTVTLSGNNSITCPTSSATINATAPAGSTFLWSNGATTSTITVSITSTTTYSLTVCNGFYTKDTTFTVHVVTSVLDSISQIQYVSCCGDSNASATMSVYGGQSPFTYSWSTNPAQTNAQATGLKAGTYTVTVTDYNGCVAITDITITQPTCLQDSILGSPSLGCNCHGTIEVFAYGGTPPYTYLWSTGGTYDTVHNLKAGEYYVRVCDNHGCCINDSFGVGSGDPVTLSQTNVTCYGLCNGSATVSTWGWNGFLWSPGGQTTATATGLCAGSYAVTVTNLDTACSATYNFTITQPTQVVVSASIITNVSCNSSCTGSALASATGGSPGYNFSWAPSGGNGAVATGLCAGTYTVTATDASGCTGSATVTISQPPPLSGNIYILGGDPWGDCADTFCYTPQIFVNGGTPPYTYSYIPFQICSTTSDFVNVNDANGCYITLYYSVYTGIKTTVTINNNVTCYGENNGSATVNQDFIGYPCSYSWSPGGQTTATVSNLSAGTYTVTTTDCSTNCTSIKIITITQPPQLSITSTVVPAACSSPGSATASCSNGTSPYTYSWSGGNGTNATATGLITGTYTVTVTDNHGCSNTAMVTVTGSGLLITPTVISYVSCRGGSNGSASVTVAGGASPYTYLWSNSQTTTSISGLSAGTYTITVTDANNCIGSATLLITQPNQLSVVSSQSSAISCYGGTNGSASSTVSGGTSPYTYSWSSGGTYSTVSNLSAGTYSLTVQDNCGASATASVAITQPAILSTAIVINTDISCNGASNGFIFANPYGGTPGYTYSWVGGGTYNAQTGLSAGTYTVVVTDANGCSVTASQTLTQPLVLSISANTITNVSCNNGISGSAGSVVTGGTKPYTYLWTGGGTTASVSNLSAGTYTVTVHDSCGASATASTVITQPNSLNLSILPPLNVACYNENNGSASPNISGGTSPYTYLWSNGETVKNAYGLSAGTYTLTITDSCGNSATASTIITQPNALTISGDSINDNGSCNGSAWVSVGGGTNPYTYLWAGGNTTDSIFSQCFGSYCCIVTDANGCLDSICVTINLSTGSGQLAVGSGQLIVYPNPNNGVFTVESSVVSLSGESQGSPWSVEIYNVLGEKVYSQSTNHQSQFTINLSDKPSGIYLYRVTKDDGSLIGEGKIVIQK